MTSRVHRCEACGMAVPPQHPTYPDPTQLSALEPHFAILLRAVAEFRANGEADADPGTPEEFLAWLFIDVERSARQQPKRHEPAGRPGRSPTDKRLLTSAA